MAALALAEALPDFGRGFTAPDICAETDGLPCLTIAAGSGTNAIQAADEHQTPDAVAAAEAALRERLEQEHEAALEAERRRHQADLDAANEAAGARLGTLIAERLAETENHLLSVTSSLAARILGAALTDDLQRRAIEEMKRVIGGALADGDVVLIRVSGPTHLCNPLKTALGDKTDRLEFSESDALDLTVTIDEELFETRLAEWSATLTDALA